MFRITKLPSKLLWGNILPSKPAHYNGTTVDACSSFFKQRFLSICWGVDSGLSRVIYRILMVRIEGIKKINSKGTEIQGTQIFNWLIIRYLIDNSTKICLVSLSIFLWNCNFISPLANELFEVDQIFKKKREENAKEEFYFINEASKY